jgi:hypothetical protein
MHRSAKAIAAHDRNQHEREHRRHLSSPDLPVEPLTLALVHALAALPPAVTVTISMPTHRPTAERQQDHIRIKNLLHQARLRIIQVDGEERAEAIIAPIDELVANPQFWTHPADGLVLFCREGSIRLLRTSTSMPELALVSEHCHIKPLMPLLQDDSRFHLLMIGSNGVRLYQGTRASLNPIDLPGAPPFFADGSTLPGSDHPVDELPNSGRNHDIVHDVGSVEVKLALEHIEAHFRRIDACVCALLQGEPGPLLLAGATDLLPVYAGVNHYHHLEPNRIQGDPDLTATTDLHGHAMTIVDLSIAKRHETTSARYAQLAGSAQASTDLPSILRNGIEGRIDHLFVASDRERWGTYDSINDKVREHHPRWPEDDDLLNLAIISALAHRSIVHVIPLALMPDHADIAAIFRY